MLVILVGYACTGKTILGKELESMGFYRAEASEYFREACLAVDSSPEFPANIGAVKRIINEYGDKLNHTVVTGIRTLDELLYLRENRNSVVIAIVSDLEECYHRANMRRREQFSSLDDFIKNRIRADCKLGIDEVIAEADIIIENREMTRESFLKNSVDVIKGYLLA